MRGFLKLKIQGFGFRGKNRSPALCHFFFFATTPDDFRSEYGYPIQQETNHAHNGSGPWRHDKYEGPGAGGGAVTVTANVPTLLSQASTPTPLVLNCGAHTIVARDARDRLREAEKAQRAATMEAEELRASLADLHPGDGRGSWPYGGVCWGRGTAWVRQDATRCCHRAGEFLLRFLNLWPGGLSPAVQPPLNISKAVSQRLQTVSPFFVCYVYVPDSSLFHFFSVTAVNICFLIYS